MATAPSLGAETLRKEPLNYATVSVFEQLIHSIKLGMRQKLALAVGVLAALRM